MESERLIAGMRVQPAAKQDLKDKLSQWKTGIAVGAKKKNGWARGEGLKVINMTGQQRLLKGYSAIAGTPLTGLPSRSSSPDRRCSAVA